MRFTKSWGLFKGKRWNLSGEWTFGGKAVSDEDAGDGEERVASSGSEGSRNERAPEGAPDGHGGP